MTYDQAFEDDLIAEIKDLRAEVETLKATLVLVREVLVSSTPRGELILSRIIDALGSVR
jgi:hypothetical protein